VRLHFGGDHERAGALTVRHARGSAFMSDVFQAGLRFRGVTSRPAFVREPEGNGCAGQLIRPLKEQLLWSEPFATSEQPRLARLAFQHRYHRAWRIERHRHCTPATVRTAFALPPAARAPAPARPGTRGRTSMSNGNDRCRRQPRATPGGEPGAPDAWAAERALVHNLRVTAELVLEALRAAAPAGPAGALPADLAAAARDLTDFLAPGPVPPDSRRR
jgi:hypothetical protein